MSVSICRFVSVCVCLPVSVCASQPVAVCVGGSVGLAACVRLCLPMSVCVSLCLPVLVCGCLLVSLCLPAAMSLLLPASVNLCPSVSVSLSLFVVLFVIYGFHMHAYIPRWTDNRKHETQAERITTSNPEGGLTWFGLVLQVTNNHCRKLYLHTLPAGHVWMSRT